MVSVTKMTPARIYVISGQANDRMRNNPGQLVASGEETTRIYNECFTPVYRFLVLRVRDRDTANDLTQDVFLKALPKIQEGVMVGFNSVLPYLYTIARNTLIDHYRKKKSIRLEEDEIYLLEDDGRADDFTKNSDDRFALENALFKLCESERVVLTLLFMEEKSYAEIAALLEKNEEAVRQIKSRALKHLRAHLEGYEY